MHKSAQKFGKGGSDPSLGFYLRVETLISSVEDLKESTPEASSKGPNVKLGETHLECVVMTIVISMPEPGDRCRIGGNETSERYCCERYRETEEVNPQNGSKDASDKIVKISK